MENNRKLWWVARVSGFFLALLILALITPVDGQVGVPAQPKGPGGKGGKGVKASPVMHQPDPTPPPKKANASAQYGAISLIENSTFGDYLGVARDCIKDEAWGDA